MQPVLGLSWVLGSCLAVYFQYLSIQLDYVGFLFFFERLGLWNWILKFEFEALLAARSKAGPMSPWLDKVGSDAPLKTQPESIYCLHMLTLGLPAKEQTEHSEQRGQSAGGAGATGTTRCEVQRGNCCEACQKQNMMRSESVLHHLTRIICLSFVLNLQRILCQEIVWYLGERSTHSPSMWYLSWVLLPSAYSTCCEDNASFWLGVRETPCRRAISKCNSYVSEVWGPSNSTRSNIWSFMEFPMFLNVFGHRQSQALKLALPFTQCGLWALGGCEQWRSWTWTLADAWTKWQSMSNTALELLGHQQFWWSGGQFLHNLDWLWLMSELPQS